MPDAAIRHDDEVIHLTRVARGSSRPPRSARGDDLRRAGFSFDVPTIETLPRRVAWRDLEHVTLTRDFLNDPDAFLRHL